jgi:hypothetical protein
MEYTKYKFNITKNKKDKPANKIISSKIYIGKMSINNMIKLKSLECPCFWICNVDARIIQYKLNVHRNKTKNSIYERERERERGVISLNKIQQV